MKRTGKKRIASVLAALLFALPLLSSCSLKPRQDLVNMLHQISDVGPSLEQPLPTAPTAATAAQDASGDTWTVLLYLCGSDLESEIGSGTANLNEILSAGWSEQVNVIVETGGTSRWHTRGISSTKLQRFQVGSTGLEKVDEQPLASMGETDTLADFLIWGTERYPADKTMVLLWNHGGGSVGGACYDEKFWMDSLTLAEMEEGFAKAGAHFDVIGFDCCLMASLETSSLLAPYGDILIASEESEPSTGWDYESWLRFLNEHPGCTGEELGREVCDSYLQKCRAVQMESMATMSVIDLAAVPAVNSAFKNMAAEMMNTTTDVSKLREVVQGARGAQSFGGNSWYEGYSNMVDLGDLVNQTKEVLPITTTAVSETLDRAVLYQINGSTRSRATGMSVFYPLGNASEFADEYCTATDNLSYLRFIDTITDTWDAPDWVYEGTTGPVEVELDDDFYQYEDYEFLDPQSPDDTISSADYQIHFRTEVSDDAVYTLTITSGREALMAVDYNLFYIDTEENKYYYLGSDVDVNADWERGVIEDAFQGEWMCIDGEFVSAELIEEDVDSALYAVPILLDGEETNLRVLYTNRTQKFEILDVYAGVDQETGMSARDSRPLEEGDEITFLFYGAPLSEDASEEDLDQMVADGEMETYEMGTIVYHEGSTRMEKADLMDGLYFYSFEVYDIFGNVYYSDPALMEIDGNDIYVEEV